MSTFSLLQISLDQTIGRDFFIDAVGVTESVTKADASQLYRDLFGILVSGISRGDAIALQQRLAAGNYPTEVVADEELPLLPDQKPMHRVTVDGEWLRFTDIMGRTTSRAMSDLVFIAGGHLQVAKIKSELLVSHNNLDEHGGLDYRRASRMEAMPQFRTEFFFWSEPNRLTLELGPERPIFFNEKAIQVHKKVLIAEVMAELRKLLPPERMSRGLLDEKLVYPNPRAYQEEIGWHFYQLGKSG